MFQSNLKCSKTSIHKNSTSLEKPLIAPPNKTANKPLCRLVEENIV